MVQSNEGDGRSNVVGDSSRQAPMVAVEEGIL